MVKEERKKRSQLLMGVAVRKEDSFFPQSPFKR